ncbi:MAG: MmcQ/YjbR family DNA-binding protein [Acidobacteriia bacterium]|nr:MmcQ/YjbR family DNA-binding protein [Terriglobia bacterium]
MSVDSIRAYCLSFLRTTEKLQWGDALCFKVGGKMFAVLGLDRLRLSFKCTPDSFAELIERQNIRPSPYVGRYKWVMLDRLDALRDDEMEDLIRQSYEMVAAKALKSRSGKAEGKKKGGRRKPIKAQARKRK